MSTQLLVKHRKDFSNLLISTCSSQSEMYLNPFPGAAAVGYAHYGQGTEGPVILSNVHCTGLESYVTDCPSDGFYNTYCSHAEDAGVACPSEQIHTHVHLSL